jgi:thiamine biosynthesis protein ThiS
MTGSATRRTAVPRLMLITDRHRTPHPLRRLVRMAIEGGVDAVQLREKDLPTAALRPLALELLAVLQEHVSLVVNGDPALAAELGVGVHLPEAGPTVAEARRMLGPQAIIGRSVHSAAETRRSDGADYLIAGHVFPSAGKPGRPPLGLDGLRSIVGAARSPVLAVGGIDASNVARVLTAGAHGVAVIGAIGAAPDPRATAATIRQIVEKETKETMGETEQGTERISVVANGKATDLPSNSTVADLLAGKGLHEKLVAVELNGTILPRQAFGTTVLAPEDRLEIVHFVGGG